MTQGRVNALFSAGHITAEEAASIITTQRQRDFLAGRIKWWAALAWVAIGIMFISRMMTP